MQRSAEYETTGGDFSVQNHYPNVDCYCIKLANLFELLTALALANVHSTSIVTQVLYLLHLGLGYQQKVSLHQVSCHL